MSESWNFTPGQAPKSVASPSAPDVPKSAPTDMPVAPPQIAALSSAPVPGPLYAPRQVPQATNGMAVASLVLGIVGVFLPVCGVLALIFGGIGISKANQGASGKGMAIAGLVLGIVGTLVTLAVIGSSGS
jgi:Domain of unknown function (DUF4190)